MAGHSLTSCGSAVDEWFSAMNQTHSIQIFVVKSGLPEVLLSKMGCGVPSQSTCLQA